MKNLVFIALFISFTVNISAQEKRFYSQMMEYCFKKADSIKQSNPKEVKDHQDNSDYLCTCLKGSIMNNFLFTTIKGDSLSIASINKPFVLFLFARFCEPCMAEIPAINYLYEKYSDKVNFIGLTCDSYKTLQGYKNKYNENVTLISSQSENVFESYMFKYFTFGKNSLPIPTVYFVNKEKQIIEISVGAQEEFHPKQFGITDPTVKEVFKETADSLNILKLEPFIKELLRNL